MPLVIQPDINSVSREEFEAHLDEVRARRIVAALELQANREMRLDAISEKLRRQINNQNEMLEKEILRLDTALENVELRLMKIGQLKSDAEQIAEQYDTEDDEDDDT